MDGGFGTEVGEGGGHYGADAVSGGVLGKLDVKRERGRCSGDRREISGHGGRQISGHGGRA